VRGREMKERGLVTLLVTICSLLSYSPLLLLRETQETLDLKRIMKISLDTLKVHSNLCLRNYPPRRIKYE